MNTVKAKLLQMAFCLLACIGYADMHATEPHQHPLHVPESPIGTALHDNYPFIIVTPDSVKALPKMSDKDFYSLSTGVIFEANSAEIQPTDPFLSLYQNEILPRINSGHLQLRKVFIRGAASPEGPYENNQRLGRMRTEALLAELRRNLQHQYITARTETNSVTEDYGYLCVLMEKASDPDYATVHRIYNATAGDERQCKQQLMAYKGGTLWKRLLRQYFPQLRSARLVLWFSEPDEVHAPKPDTIHTYDTIYVQHTVVVDSTILMPRYGRKPRTYTAKDSVQRHQLFALKTNLLFDLVTAVNGAIEVPIGRQFSLSADVVWPWWVDNKHNQWALQMGNVALEWRWYIRKWKRHSTYAAWTEERNAPLRGFFLGIHADAGYYDFELDGDGKQGEFFSAGLTLGWQKRLSKYFNMEFSLGLGAANHRYRSYEASEDERHLWKLDTKVNKWYFGPTKAKISLVWLLHQKCKK